MDGWLLGQVSTVLTALSHAQELFDGAARPTLPAKFAPRADLQDNLGGGLRATNLMMTTGAAPDATSRESMWWISDQGVRYGISLEDETLRALGISPSMARQAPWPLIRVFAPGPALSRTDAMTQHDTLAAPAEAAPLTQAQKPQ